MQSFDKMGTGTESIYSGQSKIILCNKSNGSDIWENSIKLWTITVR